MNAELLNDGTRISNGDDPEKAGSGRRLTGSTVAASLRKARPHTIRPSDDPSLRHHVLHVLLPSLGDGRDTSACAAIGVTIA
jgi:hypothetical protein